MNKIPNLTDQPATDAQRSASTALLSRPVDDQHVRRVIVRLLARSWGKATPAQALLLVAHFSDRMSPPPAEDYDLANLAPSLTLEERLNVKNHWERSSTIKEHNCLRRLKTGDYACAAALTAWVAWMVVATQAQIQAECKRVLPATANSDDWGWVRIGKQIHGLFGTFQYTEVYPHA